MTNIPVGLPKHTTPHLQMWLRALTLSVALGLPSTRAAAQTAPTSPDSDQQARLHFEQGRDAYQEGRYRDAWAEFREAYHLSGRPELLFNIGQTADRLGESRDAIKAFNMYLQRLPNATNRRDVENRVRALEERDQSAESSQPEPSAAVPDIAQPAAAATVAPAPTWHAEIAPSTLPPPAARDKSLSLRRRGLYLRAAAGLGFRSDTYSGVLEPQSASRHVSGYGLALDLAVGWAVLPGFAVGGAVLLDYASHPKLQRSGSDEATLQHLNLTTIGPFVDWYVKRQTLGLHIEGGLGLGVLDHALDNGAGSRTATGISFFLGVGYELHIASACALGLLVRFTAAALSEDSALHAFVSPSLLMSFTWF